MHAATGIAAPEAAGRGDGGGRHEGAFSDEPEGVKVGFRPLVIRHTKDTAGGKGRQVGGEISPRWMPAAPCRALSRGGVRWRGGS